MICELTNKFVYISYVIFFVDLEIEPRMYLKEVSIMDLISWSLIAPLAIITISWWWVPSVLVHRNANLTKINDTLNCKRYKCKKLIKNEDE